MCIEEVRAYNPSTEDLAEVTDLRKRAGELEESARRKRSDAESDPKKNRRQLMGDAIELEQDARKLRAQAEKKAEALGSGHFWLLGWDGEKDIMIWTDGVDERAIEYLRLGQYLSWWGDRLEVALGHPRDSDFETYRVTDIKLVAAPRNYNPRPNGRPAVWHPSRTGHSRFPRLPRE